jgi:hypothetical protein
MDVWVEKVGGAGRGKTGGKGTKEVRGSSVDPLAWLSMAGFQLGSTMMTRSAAVRVRPRPPTYEGMGCERAGVRGRLGEVEEWE